MRQVLLRDAPAVVPDADERSLPLASEFDFYSGFRIAQAIGGKVHDNLGEEFVIRRDSDAFVRQAEQKLPLLFGGEALQSLCLFFHNIPQVERGKAVSPVFDPGERQKLLHQRVKPSAFRDNDVGRARGIVRYTLRIPSA
jgi:hypothetical protein